MRKNRWQKDKLASDGAYKGNKADAQRRWSERHPDYYREYRRNHPPYVERNRQRQRQRNKRRGNGVGGVSLQSGAMIAKKDATLSVKSGTYQLIPIGLPLIAKKDAMVVALSVLSTS
jgi:hypothetical protein